jgi:hypothetical protein
MEMAVCPTHCNLNGAVKRAKAQRGENLDLPPDWWAGANQSYLQLVDGRWRVLVDIWTLCRILPRHPQAAEREAPRRRPNR